jgi:glycosyltransferase involved in cell wall biosynthesis
MSTGGDPMVSVIICTYNRPESLPGALDSVWAQDFPDWEVIVVDDGSDPPAVIPSHGADKVRVIRTEHRGVGAARALGLDAARGDLIAYCDDDDEWKTHHLSTLVDYLRDHPDTALVYGDSEWVQEGAEPSVAYSCDYDELQLSGSNYIFATDVLHRASPAREVGGFNPALRRYEDWDVWLRMSRKYRLRHLPAVLAVHRWSDGCVSTQDRWDDWTLVYDDHQRRLDAAGLAAHHGLAPEEALPAPFSCDTWREGRRELIWQSALQMDTGFGNSALQLLLALERQGVAIRMAPTRSQVLRGLERFALPVDHWGRFAFYFDWRHQPSFLRSEKVVVFSMWETNTIPRDQIDQINQSACLLYVPCRQNLHDYQAGGVRVPTQVLHLGVDPNEFPVVHRGRRGVFTFGSLGSLSPRKGIDVLLRAFQEEFLPGEPVRLLLKSTDRPPAYRIRDPRVTIVQSSVDRRTLRDLYGRMDAFVLPSRGEGFGLCGLEAMATGLPVIATDWSGPVEYLDPEDSFPLSYRLVDAGGAEAHGVRFFGMWAEPSYEHLRVLLRWLYEHPDAAAEKGRRAAARVHRHWTWDRVGRQMRDDLDALATA